MSLIGVGSFIFGLLLFGVALLKKKTTQKKMVQSETFQLAALLIFVGSFIMFMPHLGI
ncbi:MULTISPECIES: hypothetical protein [Enterococcus]|jgi:ABC-type Na+ efflux pump permease subunit|uniref:Uncharacterized protein n=1 Tax=Enterococcus dispar ATCC 51266 TaxID=1139219 RepID=S0K8F3_9ENTE|nr:hypothetical protein [Enterococcus dispar]EOT41204.1 hypothetical protein OMK_01373 [Enterococcus dispar ATCC 51266]EOW87162.1 hypothetical protein I569_02533 [Enterococcus dispar ATCC 51266]MCU7356509.1 hypothetical protein [Enterococcus dispar]MDT2704451.1 hypothetical protein [Enterococcus dispar]OJG38355.1 hypothetical protein RV01_GL002585 [Enterococcus dispar]